MDIPPWVWRAIDYFFEQIIDRLKDFIPVKRLIKRIESEDMAANLFFTILIFVLILLAILDALKSDAYATTFVFVMGLVMTFRWCSTWVSAERKFHRDKYDG